MSGLIQSFFKSGAARAYILMFSLASLLGCTGLFYYPEKQEFPLPWALRSIEFTDVFFKAQDNIRLHGRLFVTDKTPVKGTIVHYHGNSGNLTGHLIALAWVLEHGYNLFVFDYRGYGRSESSAHPEGIRLDGLAALQEARKIHRTRSPDGALIVIGQSLGGAVGLRAVLDFDDSEMIDLVVVDSGFNSYRETAFRKLASSWVTWAFSPLAYLLISDKTSASLELFTRPLLVIHSENDPVVPFECGKSIFVQVASSKKFFWKGKEFGHIMGFYSPERQKRFLEFLSSELIED